MNNNEIHDIVRGVPHMSLERANRMRSFIIEHQAKNILELGFRHGVSTCYMAHALEALGPEGHITTIDLDSARQAEPNIEQLLEAVGQRHRVTIHYEPTSYTWRMMKILEADSTPRFDLCFLDGAHSWFVDGFAFFLVDKLLKPGGWIIFDDLDWVYADSPSLQKSEGVREMPEDERETPQVRKVYELLVKTHPSYTNFETEQDWAFAQKLTSAATATSEIRQEVVTRDVGLGVFAEKVYRRLRRRF